MQQFKHQPDIINDNLKEDRPLLSLRRQVLRKRFLKNHIAIVGCGIFLIIILTAVFAPFIATRDPMDMIVRDRLHPPSREYLFGTDHFGRDVFARVIHGSRVSLRVATIVVLLTTTIGLIIGTVAGYYRHLDNPFMRVMDAMMAFPPILLAIAIMAVLGRGEMNAIIALTIVYIPTIARLIRGSVLAAKSNDYVEAVRALGGSDLRILVLHVLPNVLSPLTVQATFIYVYAILAEAGLSFLGVGTPPAIPSWGNILSEGRQYMIEAPWIMILPGLAISVTVLSLNLIGDALRDILDPRMQ